MQTPKQLFGSKSKLGKVDQASAKPVMQHRQITLVAQQSFATPPDVHTCRPLLQLQSIDPLLQGELPLLAFL